MVIEVVVVWEDGTEVTKCQLYYNSVLKDRPTSLSALALIPQLRRRRGIARRARVTPAPMWERSARVGAPVLLLRAVAVAVIGAAATTTEALRAAAAQLFKRHPLETW